MNKIVLEFINLFGTGIEAVLTWRPDAPPENWKAIIKPWERLDLIRTWAALTAFACFLTAVAMQLPATPAGH
jgi:hypothetical protein